MSMFLPQTKGSFLKRMNEISPEIACRQTKGGRLVVILGTQSKKKVKKNADNYIDNNIYFFIE